MKYEEYLKTLTECPFCAEKDRHMVAQNESAFLTYSLAPYHPDHLLVIPKRHVENILELTERESTDIELLQKEGLRILRNLGYANISLLVREGKGSGASVSHIHYHIIPDITLGNLDHAGGDRKILTEAEIQELVARLRSHV